MNHLTISELKLLQANTDVAHPLSRLALLFSCYTGLLPGDIETLQFDHIHHSGAGLLIAKPPAQRSSYIPIRVPLCKVARELFLEISERYGELPEDQQNGYLFRSLDRATINDDIRLWAHRSGIGRDIDLGIGRATFCILALEAGVVQEELASWCGTSLQAISKYQPYATPRKEKDIDAFDALFDPYLQGSEGQKNA